MYLKYVILLIFWYHPTNCLPQDFNSFKNGKQCKVVEQKTKRLKDCQFPFIYKDKAYYGCTTEGSTDGRAWCSTEVCYFQSLNRRK